MKQHGRWEASIQSFSKILILHMAKWWERKDGQVVCVNQQVVNAIATFLDPLPTLPEFSVATDPDVPKQTAAAKWTETASTSGFLQSALHKPTDASSSSIDEGLVRDEIEDASYSKYLLLWRVKPLFSI